jgi:predicted nucleotidyltransferase
MIDSGTAAWLDDLPAELARHVTILRRMVEEVNRDPRLRALQVQGSLGRGTGDQYSDLDVGLVIAEAAWPGFADELPALIRRLGDVVDDYYEFQPYGATPQVLRSWIQYLNGIQLDLLVVPATTVLGSGPDGRTLFDPDGLLPRTDNPMRRSGAVDIARWSFICWGALAETAKNVARKRPVSAIEWLNSARRATISCWAAAHDLDFAAYANVVAATMDVSGPWLDGLEETYPLPESTSVGAAALKLAQLQTKVDALLAERFQIQPRPWAAWVSSELLALQIRDNRQGTRSRSGKRRGATRRSTPPPDVPRAH